MKTIFFALISMPLLVLPAYGEQVVGVVTYSDHNRIEVRQPSGEIQTFKPRFKSEVSTGSIVFVDYAGDEAKSVALAEVDRKYRGIVSAIADEDQVRLSLKNGESYTATISPMTIKRLGIKIGTPLKVTTYKGTSVIRVCLDHIPQEVVAPEPPKVVPTIETPPVEPVRPVEPSIPVRGLW